VTGVEGGDAVMRQLGRMSKAALTNVTTEVVRGAVQIQATAVESIQRGPKTGRTYRKSASVTHQASAR